MCFQAVEYYGFGVKENMLVCVLSGSWNIMGLVLKKNMLVWCAFRQLSIMGLVLKKTCWCVCFQAVEYHGFGVKENMLVCVLSGS